MVSAEEYRALKQANAKLAKQVDVADAARVELTSKSIELSRGVDAARRRISALMADLHKCEEELARPKSIPESVIADSRDAAAAADAAEAKLAAAEAALARAPTPRPPVKAEPDLDAYLPSVYPRGGAVWLHPAADAPAGAPAGWAWRLLPGAVEGHRSDGIVMVRFAGCPSAVPVIHSNLRPGSRPGDAVVAVPPMGEPMHGWLPGVAPDAEGTVVGLENAFARVYFPYEKDASLSDGAVREMHVREIRPASRARLARGEVVFVTEAAIVASSARPAAAALCDSPGAPRLHELRGRAGVVVLAGDPYETADAAVTVDFGDIGRFDIPAGALTAPFVPGTLVVCADSPALTPEPVFDELSPQPAPKRGHKHRPRGPTGEGLPLLRQPGQVMAREVGAVLGVAESVVFAVFPSCGRIACRPSALIPAPGPAVSAAALQRGDFVAVPPGAAPPFVGAEGPLRVDRAVGPAAPPAAGQPRVEVLVQVGARPGLCRWALDPAAARTLLHGPGVAISPGDRVTISNGNVGTATAVERALDGTVSVRYHQPNDTASTTLAANVAVRAAPVPHPLLPLLSRVALRRGASSRVPNWSQKAATGVLRGTDDQGYACVEFPPARAGAPADFVWVRARLLISAQSGVPYAPLRVPRRPGLLDPPSTVSPPVAARPPTGRMSSDPFCSVQNSENPTDDELDADAQEAKAAARRLIASRSPPPTVTAPDLDAAASANWRSEWNDDTMGGDGWASVASEE